jgi:hypothetical protein
MRFALIPALIVLACWLAAAYGALHNQISYAVGPDYFHAFKFIQFNVAPSFPPRLAAAIVGVQASWWMGLVIGVPIAVVCAFAPDVPAMLHLFLRAALLVVIMTLTLGTATLLLPAGDMLSGLIPMPPAVRDPVGFSRAALMHDTSYLAGVLSLLAGLAYTGRTVRRLNARKKPPGA